MASGSFGAASVSTSGSRPRSASPGVQVSTRSPPPTRVSSPAAEARPRTPSPTPAATVAPSPALATGAAPRGVTVERTLGEDAVNRLSTDELRTRLMAEMAKNEQLHLTAERLRDQLAQSQEREADLVELIGRWSSRE